MRINYYQAVVTMIVKLVKAKLKGFCFLCNKSLYQKKDYIKVKGESNLFRNVCKECVRNSVMTTIDIMEKELYEKDKGNIPISK